MAALRLNIMKLPLRMMFVSVLTLVTVRSAFAQGSLTPPGARRHTTMKTLDPDQASRKTDPPVSLFGIYAPGHITSPPILSV